MLSVATASVCRCGRGNLAVRGILGHVSAVNVTITGARGGHRGYRAQTPSHHDVPIQDIRNIGIIAHVDAGKTTTTERMLYYSGVTRFLGNVDDGNTVTDFLQLEMERGITIQSAAITFNWPLPEDCTAGNQPKTINLIDTPGHQDFRFEVDRCLPVLDGAVTIIDSVKGVEAHTERVWASAQQFQIPRIMFVNKLDRDGASFRKSVLDIASRLNSWPIVCQIPWWDGDEFVGVVDVVSRVGMRWKSKDNRVQYDAAVLHRDRPQLAEEMETAREKLIEKLCEDDEELTEAFTEHELNVSPEAIKKSIRRAIQSGDGSVVPVFAGASLREIGVEPLLDAVVDYLPNPAERPDLEVRVGAETHRLKELLESHDKSSKQKGQKGQKQSHITGLLSVFKVANDPQRGLLTFVRAYHGSLARNASMWNATMHMSERSLNMLQISASKTREIPHLSTGHIGALTGLKNARTGDTLVAFQGNKVDPVLSSIQIRPPEIPAAVAFIAIDAFSDSKAKALEEALEKISKEDPSLRWNRNEKDGVFVLSGMGKLHLEVARHRLSTDYKVEAHFGDVEIDYKECLDAASGPQHYVFDRIVASVAGKAACTATIESLSDPGEPDTAADRNSMTIERDGNVFHICLTEQIDGTSPLDGDVVRHQLFNGAYAALARGPRRNSPIFGCRATITCDPAADLFGSATPSGAHVTKAAFHAVKACLDLAHARSLVSVLEPVMRVRIQCPEYAAGEIQQDITSRHGGTVLEVSSEFGTSTSAANSSNLDDESSSVPPINIDDVYAPPDPYESVHSLRDSKKGVLRTLEIRAKVPLKEALDYDNYLRGVTQGRHSLHMDLDTFEKVTGVRSKGL